MGTNAFRGSTNAKLRTILVVKEKDKRLMLFIVVLKKGATHQYASKRVTEQVRGGA